MARILLIETATARLSTALSEDGTVTAFRVCDEPRMQASLTAPYVQEVLQEKGLSVKDLDAVCVGRGPGSYTGLRVGVSTAKGLCFGGGIPLLSVGTLDTLVSEAHRLGVVPEGCRYIVPMVDARRMEVYTAVFENGRQITETAPAIIDETSFAEYLEQGPCLFIGDGAGKCADVIKHPDATFVQCWPKASSMVEPALAAYRSGDFKDVAYFEPFYLKEFVATVSKKKMW
jgi:tRNA threonylcarbamoyladenosine biosynthesis protein TsaB